MVLEVHVPTLSAASVDLSAAAERLDGTRRFLRGVALPADDDVAAGLDAVKAAWGAAMGVLVEDMRFMSTQVAGAADVYDTGDRGLARRARDRINRPDGPYQSW